MEHSCDRDRSQPQRMSAPAKVDHEVLSRMKLIPAYFMSMEEPGILDHVFPKLGYRLLTDLGLGVWIYFYRHAVR